MSTYLLRIYQAPSGQWSGIVFEDGDELARIAGCEAPHEVEDTARETWPAIEVEQTEETEAFYASLRAGPTRTSLDPADGRGAIPTCRGRGTAASSADRTRPASAWQPRPPAVPARSAGVVEWRGPPIP